IPFQRVARRRKTQRGPAGERDDEDDQRRRDQQNQPQAGQRTYGGVEADGIEVLAAGHGPSSLRVTARQPPERVERRDDGEHGDEKNDRDRGSKRKIAERQRLLVQV